MSSLFRGLFIYRTVYHFCTQITENMFLLELIVKNQGPDDACVLNYEDEVLREIGRASCRERV